MFFLNKKFDARGRGRKKKRRYISVWKLTMLELMQLSQLPCCCPMRSHASTLYSYSFAPGHMRGKGRGFTTLEEHKFVFDNLWKLNRCPIYDVHSLIFCGEFRTSARLRCTLHTNVRAVGFVSSPSHAGRVASRSKCYNVAARELWSPRAHKTSFPPVLCLYSFLRKYLQQHFFTPYA